MRKSVVTSFLVFMLLVVGCSSNYEQPEVVGDDGTKQPVVEQPERLDMSDVQEVKISRSLQFGVVNEAMLGVFGEQASMDIFVDAIETGVKIEGILDIRRPDYDVSLASKDVVHSIHLWLDTDIDGGMYTLVSDTGTGYTLTTDAASSLKRLIMNIPYTPEQAEHNGDVVNLHGITFYNLDKWDAFFTNVEGGASDRIQVTSYTTEGDPIFINMNYDGQSIEYSYDTAMDAFGSPTRTSAFCERIESKLVDKGTEYSLAGCDNSSNNDGRKHLLVIPNH